MDNKSKAIAIILGIGGISTAIYAVTKSSYQLPPVNRRIGTLTILAKTATGTPLSGVFVQIDMVDGYANLSRSSFTDSLGYCVFAAIPEGEYRQRLTKIGYKPYESTRPVIFNSDGTTQHAFGLAIVQ